MSLKKEPYKGFQNTHSMNQLHIILKKTNNYLLSTGIEVKEKL